MDKISIIVPIYNVEKYLEQCIESIINQDYKNLEIILVDDGSPDRCANIIDEYAKKDNRIKAFHKENGGLSDARNYGLDRATGEYICFVDSDDFVEKDFISSMYNNIKKYNVDIAACNSYDYYNKNKIKVSNYMNVEKLYNKDEANKYLYIIGYYNVGVWNKMYIRRLWNKLRFPVGKKSEDIYVMYEIINNSNGLYYSAVPKYYYRQREGSITNSNNINYDVIQASKKALQFYKENDIEEVMPYAMQYLVFAYIGIYNAILCRKKDKKKMKEIRREVLALKKEIIYDEISKSRKIQLFLFLHLIGIYNILFIIYDYKRDKEGQVNK